MTDQLAEGRTFTDEFDATFDGCKLIGSVFTDCVLRPVRIAGGHWRAVTIRGTNLSKLDLAGLDLRVVDLSLSDLTGAGGRGAARRAARRRRRPRSRLSNTRARPGCPFADTTGRLHRWVRRNGQPHR